MDIRKIVHKTAFIILLLCVGIFCLLAIKESKTIDKDGHNAYAKQHNQIAKTFNNLTVKKYKNVTYKKLPDGNGYEIYYTDHFEKKTLYIYENQSLNIKKDGSLYLYEYRSKEDKETYYTQNKNDLKSYIFKDQKYTGAKYLTENSFNKEISEKQIKVQIFGEKTYLFELFLGFVMSILVMTVSYKEEYYY